MSKNFVNTNTYKSDYNANRTIYTEFNNAGTMISYVISLIHTMSKSDYILWHFK